MADRDREEYVAAIDHWKARITELEALLQKEKDRADAFYRRGEYLEKQIAKPEATLQTAVDRAADFEAENAALKEYKVRYGKVIGNNLTRISELKGKNTELREALGTLDKELAGVEHKAEESHRLYEYLMKNGKIIPSDISTLNGIWLESRASRALIEAALKGV